MFSKLFPGKVQKEMNESVIGSMIIIDDERTAHQALSPMIRGINYAPISAYSMKDVEKAFSHHQSPSVVFLDVYMPGVDTLKILSYCKKKDSDVHIIIISGSNNLNVISSYITAGADDFLLKPFNRKMFMAKAKLALMINGKEADESLIGSKDKLIQKLKGELQVARLENEDLQKELNSRPLSDGGNLIDEDVRTLIGEVYHKVSKSIEDKQAVEVRFTQKLQADLKEALAEKEALQEELNKHILLDTKNAVAEDTRILVNEVYDKVSKSIENKELLEAKLTHDLNNALLGLTALKELVPANLITDKL